MDGIEIPDLSNGMDDVDDAVRKDQRRKTWTMR